MLLSAPPGLSSSPSPPPAQSGAVTVMQNPWFHHPDNPGGVPAAKGHQKHCGCKKVLSKSDRREQEKAAAWSARPKKADRKIVIHAEIVV